MELEEEPVEEGAVRCFHGATEVWAPVCICVISVCSHAALACSDCKLGDPESRASATDLLAPLQGMRHDPRSEASRRADANARPSSALTTDISVLPLPRHEIRTQAQRAPEFVPPQIARRSEDLYP